MNREIKRVNKKEKVEETQSSRKTCRGEMKKTRKINREEPTEIESGRPTRTLRRKCETARASFIVFC